VSIRAKDNTPALSQQLRDLANTGHVRADHLNAMADELTAASACFWYQNIDTPTEENRRLLYEAVAANKRARDLLTQCLSERPAGWVTSWGDNQTD
jgi:hypothetical protein